MNFDKFINKNPVHKKEGWFQNEEIEELKGKLPDGVIEFLSTFGRCSFADGFFSTVHPFEVDYKTLFKSWGFKDGDYYIFLKTCFGTCAFFHEGNFYYIETQKGDFQNMMGSINLFMNSYFSSHLFVNDTFRYDVFAAQKDQLPELKSDEIYMLVPAIPLGGSFESSKLEVGKMFEHLCLLADLYGNKAREIE